MLDAPPGVTFPCLTTANATTANASLTVVGTLSGLLAGNSFPMSATTTQIFRTGNATALASVNTDADGIFVLPFATGGVPVDGYIEVPAASVTYVDSYFYPPQPFHLDRSLTFVQTTTDTIAGFHTGAGVTPQTGKGFVWLRVLDCDGHPIAGAKVTSSLAATARYNDAAGQPSPTATTTAADGIAYLLNVTPGAATIDGTVGAVSLREHVVQVRASVLTMSELTP